MSQQKLALAPCARNDPSAPVVLILLFRRPRAVTSSDRLCQVALEIASSDVGVAGEEVPYPRMTDEQTDFETTVIVHTFVSKPFKFFSAGSISVAFLKKVIARNLNLKKSSLKVFGLFLCSKNFPFAGGSTMFCKEKQKLSGCLHLSFRRLSFDRIEEMEVCERDKQAASLLLKEAKFILECDSTLPVFSVEYKKRIQRKLKTLPLKEQYSEVRNMYKFWWVYYYRANSYDYVPPSGIVFKSFVRSIAITQNYIILLHGNNSWLERVPFENVLSVKTEVSESGDAPKRVAIDIIVFMDESEDGGVTAVLDHVSICTYSSEYLVSLIEVVLETFEKSQSARKDHITDRFDNLLFQGPSFYAMCPLQPGATGYSYSNPTSLKCPRDANQP